MRTSHEKNTSDNYAFQEIGQLSSYKPTFPPKSVAMEMGGAFNTNGNTAKNGAAQRLYASDDPNMTTTYNANVSDTGATQNLGMDVGIDLPVNKFKKWGRSRNKRPTMKWHMFSRLRSCL